MGKRILFSPIGMTDPITNYRDGSMLHICRVYKPDIVYLYLSAETYELHERDNRYVYCIEQLASDMNHLIETRVIVRSELHNVQEYDIFYDDFHSIISDIQNGMEEEDKLFLNIASGTPAMKSALLLLSVLVDSQISPIQVSTPEKKSNKQKEDPDNYDVETYWELDEDNQPDFENRCKEPQNRNLSTLLKMEQIVKFIGEYDYSAALMIAREIEKKLNVEAYTMLVVAYERLRLNTSEVDKLLKKQDIVMECFPVKSGNARLLFEYALNLQIKMKKGEYADFLRALTPLVAELVEMILLKQCKIDVNTLCYINSKRIRKFDEGELKKKENEEIYNVLQEEFKGNFRADLVGTRQMVPLICHFSKDEVLGQKCKAIMDFEQKVRNLAAHEIVSVTDSWIKKKTGVTSGQIFAVIQYLIVQAGIHAQKDDWNCYDIMNKLIVDKLK